VKTFGKKGASVKGGREQAITWKVNRTQRLADQVRIVLSTNNGRTWKRVLDGRTANDGRAVVRFPDVKTTKAWVKVEAVDNYFFDVNGKAFRIK